MKQKGVRESLKALNYIIETAKLCYTVDKAYDEALGNYSQTDWDNAPDWQKDTNINGVENHFFEEINTPSDSHKSWLKEKLDNGWKYGKVKDPEKKEHPCCVAFEDLPKEQQAKDYIFKAICDGAKLGFSAVWSKALQREL